MRDIRPTNKKKTPWQGSSVPITSISVTPAPQGGARSHEPPAPPPPSPTPPPTPPATPGPVAPLPPTPAPKFARAPLKKEPRRRWRIGRRERMVMVGLLLVALLTGGLAAIIFLPVVDITLVLRTAPLLVDETLTLRARGGDEGVIPGTAFFREIQVEGSQISTGQEVIGTKTRGVVEIVNRTTEEQKIKEQSRLVTEDGTLFFMQKAAILPPGPSRVAVEVEADVAGEAGNIEPQKLFFAALDEGVRPLLYAETAKKLTGGSGETVQVITEKDIESARASAGQTARQQVEPDILNELPKGWRILGESWTYEIAAFETDKEVGQREAAISFTARVLVRVMGYEEEALANHLRAALEERMDKEFVLFPGPLSFVSTVKNVNWEAGEAELSVRVTHTTIPNIQIPTLRGKILGQSIPEAKTYLEGLPGVRSVDIQAWPFWVNSIPRIENRVKLDFQSERQP